MSELTRLPTPAGTTYLHRFSIKPGHLDAYLEMWPQEVSLRRRHGFVLHQAYLETHAEPKLTWLYSHPEGGGAVTALAADPESAELAEAKRLHVFGNLLVRPVRPEILTSVMPADLAGRIAIMRRYSIVNGWPGFLDIWRQIVPVREQYGFRCLFAVADEPRDMFTWAFDFTGSWGEFPSGQRDYYRDPSRVALRGVFDYMADYAITPAHPLPLS